MAMIKFVKYKENSHMENKSRLKPLRSFLALNIPKQHFFFNIARILEDASIPGSGYNLGPWKIFSPAIFLFSISQTPTWFTLYPSISFLASSFYDN